MQLQSWNPRYRRWCLIWRVLLLPVAACSAPVASPRSGAPVIDRFGAAGHLLARAKNPALPGPDQPFELDRPPFVTQGLGPDGRVVRYYNFDIQPDHPGLAYQLPDVIVVDAIPGDPGYSDFWRIARVDVPAGYVPGSITSAAQIRDRGWTVTPGTEVIDCPIVPRGTAGKEGGIATEFVYRGARVQCLRFERALAIERDRVPTSPIYVTFAGERFRTEAARPPQTHNVVFSVPGDADYSPLWAVHVYDPRAFDLVHDAETAGRARVVDEHGPLVNCPIVFVAN